MKLLLIDAYAMIFRAYYAFIRAPRITSKGENVSAVFGFCHTLEDLKKKVQPTHLGVAFDPSGGTFRHEAYDQYKAQREETPEDIRKAVPIIKTILESMRIPVLEVAGFEADDVIGTLAKKAESAGFDSVLMATPDKDYGQLVTERIHMYRPKFTGGFEELGPQDVCQKYGIDSTAQVIDLLGLMGDASDNIPGCKGVGEKTAVSLIQQFGSIDNMLAHTDQIKGAMRLKVESQAEEIRFSRFLATIRQDVPIDLDVEALALTEPDMPELTRLYTELEFRSLLPNTSSTKTSSSAKTPKTSKTSKPILPSLFDEPAEEQTLFDAPEEAEAPYSEEARLAQYILNPELAYNPACPPDMNLIESDEKLRFLFHEMELPLTPVLRKMEQAGVRFDTAVLKEASQQMHAELDEIEQQIRVQAEPYMQGALNINSPKQIGDLLFAHMHLDPKAKKTKSGQYVTSEEVLQGIKLAHPIVPLILEYRELKKLLSTYIDALPLLVNPKTGKIHTTYNQTVTATGRLSSSNPNLQNLPIRSERGKFIRKAVVPDEGCIFLSADYSQIELRLMAHLSGDEHMLAAFRSGQDIHVATAAKIFAKPIEEVTSDERRKAKTANFGIIYGISAFGLSQQLDCPRGEAKQLIDDYFAAFPGVTKYIEQCKQTARNQGFVETAFGRKRYLPDINSHNATVRAFAERNAVNAPIQGMAADIIKLAMVRIDRRLQEQGLKAQMIMQVHDELNFNVPAAEVEQVREIVVSEMEHVISLSVPLIAECGVGANWLEAH